MAKKNRGIVEWAREHQERITAEARAALDRAYYGDSLAAKEAGRFQFGDALAFGTGIAHVRYTDFYKEPPMKSITATFQQIDNGILVSLDVETSIYGRGGGPMVYADDIDAALDKARELVAAEWGKPSAEKDCDPEEGNVTYGNETMARDVPVMTTEEFAFTREFGDRSTGPDESYPAKVDDEPKADDS